MVKFILGKRVGIYQHINMCKYVIITFLLHEIDHKLQQN